MDIIKRKRTAIRTAFTKTVNALKEKVEIRDALFDRGVIEDKMARVTELHLELKRWDGEILDIMVHDELDDEVIDTELENAGEYVDQYITIKRLVNERLKGATRLIPNNENVATLNKNKTCRLPKIQLQQFDGQLINYISFWSQFKKIHEDTELEDSDKFMYLVQSIKPGNSARELVESYPLTAENYPKVISAFQQRFGRKELLVEVYVRELLRLVITNASARENDKLPLSDLFVKIEAYLRSLETMGIETEANSVWLGPIIESTLSNSVLRAWQRSPLAIDNCENSKNTPRLTQLMQFLRREVEGEERLLLARSGFHGIAPKDEGPPKGKVFKDKQMRKVGNNFTAAGLLAVKENQCIFCLKAHESKDCLNARSLSIKEKISKVKDKRCCLRCLKPGHVIANCKSYIRCHVCAKLHPEILCPELPFSKNSEKESDPPELIQNSLAKQKCSKDVALMTLEVLVKGVKSEKRIRCLCDSGSQKSYLLSSTAEELGLECISTINIAHSLFGGTRTEARPHKRYNLKLCASGSHSNAEFKFEVLEQENICSEIPRLPKGPLLKELKRHKIWLSDIGPGNTKIELLIGSDIYGKLLTGQVKQLSGGLTAIQTKLGWTVCGQHESSQICEARNLSTFITNLAVRDLKIPELWNLETIGIRDPKESLIKANEDEWARDHFNKSLSRNSDGRYCVGLPWIEKQCIPSNRNIAEKRLFSTTKRLKSSNKFKDYNNVFQEWKNEGVIEIVPDEELEREGHYLPHHPVIKLESSTTKIRPVFDASCKSDRVPSLNDCLMKGPNLIEQIPSILLRFREKRLGVVSDIRKAFLQIEIGKEDRDYLRFLWWEKEDKVVVFRHKRVVFGVNCSPFLLGAVIINHLSNVSDERRIVAEKLSKSFYVDNCVTSVNDESELEDFISKATDILAEAKMDLRMWEFGPKGEINSSEFYNQSLLEKDLTTSVPLLGLQWDRCDDSLLINSKFQLKSSNPSKREILSVTQGIFDPIGFLAPALLPAKLLIQEAWANKFNWDAPLPERIRDKFLKWYHELHILSDVKIPRRIGYGDKEHWSMHVFCDASKSAYATVIFLLCGEGDGISVSLVGAKSRLSPLKRMTIPRLELLACNLGARLSEFYREELDLSEDSVYFWSDSTTALAWIQRNNQWGTFVGNRVREICQLTNPNQWSYIPGQINPADLPSRGCSPRQLIESKWWEGPVWLKDPKDNWLKEKPSPNEDLILAERKKVVMIETLNTTPNEPMWYEKISKFSRIVRVLAWALRFVHKVRKQHVCNEKTLTVSEIEDAENTLWLSVQQRCFPATGDSIKGLMVIVDSQGMIRIKTKIVEREDEFSFRYPLLLPTKHHLVICLISELHTKNCHAGVQWIAAKLREKFWIISAKRVIRNTITKCVICKRFTAKARETPPIHLPLDRVRDASVFEIVGIDLCGPLFLKNKIKCWIVLFTCAVYRAVHLEVVTTLSTESFIQALRRFIARRGRPITIYSDNGTNFIGANNLLKGLDWDKITNSDQLYPIRWKFIPPTACWWGGWWERLVRSVKTLLVRVLGHASLNYEELNTILCDVEATLNDRPLTYIGEGSNDLVPLTPSMFINDLKEIGVPDLDSIDSKKLIQRYKHCQNLRQELRNRFRKEYLGQLIQRAGCKGESVKTGDVVLVGVENLKRLNWPMAKVIRIFPSRDGAARVAEVRTKTGTLIRPLQKLYPLEISTSEDPVIQKGAELRSRFGRVIRPPERLAV